MTNTHPGPLPAARSPRCRLAPRSLRSAATSPRPTEAARLRPASARLPAAAQGGRRAITVGFIYVGPQDDYGYNQAHAEGAAALAKLPGVKIREEEKVPETVAVQKTMESMINLDGAKLLFPTSFGYFDPHILKVAEKYPNVTFLHCGGLYDARASTRRTSAATSATSTRRSTSPASSPGSRPRRNKLGFIAAKPIPQVLRNINAFTLGARSVNPKVTTTVIFTGDWSLPVKEAEAANSLIDQGVDVLTMHVDSPEGDRRDRRAARHLQLPATTPARRRWRPRAT